MLATLEPLIINLSTAYIQKIYLNTKKFLVKVFEKTYTHLNFLDEFSKAFHVVDTNITSLYCIN